MKALDWTAGDRGSTLCCVLILVVALGALASRVPRLRMRPMHTDEAVHADKFGTLLERGRYRYDPYEYHGPTLNYFTLIPAWLTSDGRYADITEATLRIVPVAFGVLLVALTALMVRGLGPAALPAALLAAISPAMFFYSRYYIQETLLVCFTFGALVAGYRYVCTRAWPWAVVAGGFAGLMHATKETCVVAFGAMGLSLVLVTLMRLARWRSLAAMTQGMRWRHLGLGLTAAVVVSALFCSSFLTHPRGVLDSYLTYGTYFFTRAGGHDSPHIHPWHYYLKMLLFSRYGDGPIWTEGAIVFLAVVGFVAAVRGRGIAGMDVHLLRFVAFYTLAMTIAYSAISYKTPWCLLGFLHGMILQAGVGIVVLIRWVRQPVFRVAFCAVLAAAAAHLAFQAYRGSFVYAADNRNPYVYGHTSEGIFPLVEAVEAYAGIDGLGETVPFDVVCVGDDYWPLPWYLRAYRVRWSNGLPTTVGPLIVISEDLQDVLAERTLEQQQMYTYLLDEPYYAWLRPNVRLFGFVRRTLWKLKHEPPEVELLTEGEHG